TLVARATILCFPRPKGSGLTRGYRPRATPNHDGKDRAPMTAIPDMPPKTETVLALSERLRRWGSKNSWSPLAPDTRLAAVMLNKFASLLITDELDKEKDPQRKAELGAKASRLWNEA